MTNVKTCLNFLICAILIFLMTTNFGHGVVFKGVGIQFSTLRGVVKDEIGNPLSEIDISWINFKMNKTLSTYTDSAGIYTFYDVLGLQKGDSYALVACKNLNGCKTQFKLGYFGESFDQNFILQQCIPDYRVSLIMRAINGKDESYSSEGDLLALKEDDRIRLEFLKITNDNDCKPKKSGILIDAFVNGKKIEDVFGIREPIISFPLLKNESYILEFKGTNSSSSEDFTYTENLYELRMNLTSLNQVIRFRGTRQLTDVGTWEFNAHLIDNEGRHIEPNKFIDLTIYEILETGLYLRDPFIKVKSREQKDTVSLLNGLKSSSERLEKLTKILALLTLALIVLEIRKRGSGVFALIKLNVEKIKNRKGSTNASHKKPQVLVSNKLTQTPGS